MLCMCALPVFLACSWQRYAAIYCLIGLDVLEQFTDVPNRWPLANPALTVATWFLRVN